MSRRTSEDIETWTCDGCGGDVPVSEAVWLPESLVSNKTTTKPRPYCCQECHDRFKREKLRSAAEG